VSYGFAGVPSIGVADLAADPDAYVVDVREVHEFQSGHVPGAVSIPMSVLPVRVHELPRDRTLHVICQSGGRSAQVVQWLEPQGYDAVNVAGGTAAWILSGRTVE
jgi:rhodanese-related sulfurtransferase